MYSSALYAIGHSGTTTIRKISVKADEHQGERDLVGSALAHRAFDQRDHPVEERFAGRGGDPHDDAVGQAPWCRRSRRSGRRRPRGSRARIRR